MQSHRVFWLEVPAERYYGRDDSRLEVFLVKIFHSFSNNGDI
jgi:hypothetical protein